MKKFIVAFILFILGCVILYGQEITMKQIPIYYGHPKILKQTIVEANQQVIIEFDYDGRVISKSMGAMKMKFSWDQIDEGIIIAKVYNNGNFVQSGTIYISEFSESEYEYDFEGTTYYTSFNDNGRISLTEMNNAQVCVTTRYKYSNQFDDFPSSVVYSMSQIENELRVRVDELDSYGNILEMTATALNGQGMTTVCEIEYY